MAAEKRKNIEKYIPVPNDPVDVAMADFCKRKLPVPIVRESSEIYLFGTKQVHVTLDNEVLAARVPGGGLIPLVEFVERNLHEQADKFKVQECRKRLTRYASDAAHVVRESSPERQRGGGASPMKKGGASPMKKKGGSPMKRGSRKSSTVAVKK